MVCITERDNTDHAACDACKNGPHAVATRPSISNDSARGISTNRAPRLCTETTGCSGWSTSSLTSLMMMIMMTTMRRCCISRMFFRRNRCARHAPLLLRRRRQMDVGTDQQLYSSLSLSLCLVSPMMSHRHARARRFSVRPLSRKQYRPAIRREMLF